MMICIAALGPAAAADYVLTAQVGGQSSAVVAAGQSVAIDFLLTTDAADVHNSAIFVVSISAPGLVLESYAWASPFATGSIFDASTPPIAALPLLIDTSTLSGPGYPPGLIGFELANVIPIPGPGPGEMFATGVIVTAVIHVPADWLASGGSDLIIIDVLPDTFAAGFDVVPTTAGAALSLIVIPGPAALALLALALWAEPRRKRGRQLATSKSPRATRRGEQKSPNC